MAPVKDTGPVAPPKGAKAKITVGVHGDDGAAAKADAPELTVAAVASFHEFGLGVPQRSFIRDWFDERIEENKTLLASQMRLVAAGRIPLETALERVALKLEASVRNRIRARIPPPLAQSTIDRKGSSTPLISTGQLVSAVRAKAEVLK